MVNPETIKRRLTYFLLHPAKRSRAEVQWYSSALQQHGEVAVIGGAIRDVALKGLREFSSDVDFVVSAYDKDALYKYLLDLGARKNKFGGFCISGRKWKIDVWELSDTWTIKQGHLDVFNFSDLTKMTFFNFDAIVFSLNSRTLYWNTFYFDDINRRILRINFEPNPDPLGQAVRAFRYAFAFRTCFDRNLSNFVIRQINGGWNRLFEREERSFSRPILRRILNGNEADRVYQILASNYAVTNPVFQNFGLQERLIEVDCESTVF